MLKHTGFTQIPLLIVALYNEIYNHRQQIKNIFIPMKEKIRGSKVRFNIKRSSHVNCSSFPNIWKLKYHRAGVDRDTLMSSPEKFKVEVLQRTNFWPSRSFHLVTKYKLQSLLKYSVTLFCMHVMQSRGEILRNCVNQPCLWGVCSLRALGPPCRWRRDEDLAGGRLPTSRKDMPSYIYTGKRLFFQG